MALFGRKRRVTGNPNRSGSNALTAAGFKIKKKDADALRRLVLPWQARSFAYYDLIPEIKYAAQFYSRLLAPLKLYVEERQADGEWVESTDKDAIDALDRIQDPGGTGRTGLLASYGRLMFLAGECYLFVTLDRDTGLEQWEMLSTDELRPIGETYVRYRAPSLPAEEFREADDDSYYPEDDESNWGAVPQTAVAYRLWQKHPRFSMYADCTMQGVLDLCEELVLLTQAVRARARSRLAGSGILFISEDFSMAPLEASPDEDSDEDPFMSDLTNAMTAPIADEGTASAIVPLVVRGPTEAIEKGVRHTQIIDPTQIYPETGLRYELIKRLAIGLDMPPEQLLGMTDANHWTGWMIDEQTWKNHGLPKAIQLCDDLNQSYFTPFLRESAGKADWDRFRIAFDPSTVINHPDRTKDAKELFDRNIVGKAYVREVSGVDEDAAPTAEERAERIGILCRDASLAWYGIPSPRGGALEPQPGELVTGQGQTNGTTNGATSGADAVTGPPPGGPTPAQVAQEEAVASAAAFRLAGAADLALHRAREAAGNRLKGYAKRDHECLAAVEGVRAGQVAATLGKERVRALRVPSERELVAGTREIILDALRVYGVLDEAVVDALVDQVEQHAVRTLYDERPAPLPETFRARIAGMLLAARKPTPALTA